MQFSERLDDMISMLRRLDDRAKDASKAETSTDANENGVGTSNDLAPNDSIANVVVNALNYKSSPEGLQLREELVDYLWNQKRIPAQQDRIIWMEGKEASTSNELRESHESFADAIAKSLTFETIEVREEAIPKAFEKTFSWILLREPAELDGQSLWSSFPDWLEGSTKEPYWITGKPGSGKSTLMKFALRQPSLKVHLQKWADNMNLLVTSYYAWVAGSDLQKSCEGLMRTLLYKILTLNPSLVPEVAPRRWALFVTLRRIQKLPSWSSWEIEESFELLLSKCGRTTKIALFIDGLDEFDSPPFRVLELIQKINSWTHIKVCVASRQWTEFNDAFNQSPMLRMQDLTTADMAYFVEAKLEANRGFLELRRIFPTEAAHLIRDVVTKANGVFLWVSMVIRSLLEALTEGDGLAELQTTVDLLPSDIAQLYDAIWSRISDRNITASSKLLVTFKAALSPLSYITLWLSDEKQSLNFDINSLYADARAGIEEIMRRRLDSKTRGILEISPGGTVDFLHRTARDWAFQPSVWERICSPVPEGFDPYLLLLKAETIRISDKSHWRRGMETMAYLWTDINKCLWYASRVVDSPANTSELVRILDKLNSQVDKIADPHLLIRFGPTSLLPAGGYATRDGIQIRLRWPSTQDPQLGGRGNTFLGLIAQFCILPYLRNAVVLDPSNAKLKTRKNFVSLLENAVFGYPEVNDPRTTNTFHIPSRQRIETVRFLLERGASPRQTMFNGNVLMDEVHRAVATAARKADGYDGESYWARIEELMETKIKWRWTLKSIFGRTKSP